MEGIRKCQILIVEFAKDRREEKTMEQRDAAESSLRTYDRLLPCHRCQPLLANRARGLTQRKSNGLRD